jgi:osmotically-inducible protein OsmY
MGLRTNILFSLMVFLPSCSSYDKSRQISFGRAFRVPDTVSRTSGEQGNAPQSTVAGGITAGEFARRIVGGELIRAESGILVIRASGAKDSLQPIGLTTDAIITSSLLSKLGSQPRLKADGFEVTTSNGVVSIHARNDSIDDAIAMINLALTVPDVREVVYAIPTRV